MEFGWLFMLVGAERSGQNYVPWELRGIAVFCRCFELLCDRYAVRAVQAQHRLAEAPGTAI